MNKQDVVDQAKRKLEVISDIVNNIGSNLEVCRNSVNGGFNEIDTVQLIQLLDSAVSNLRAAYSESRSLVSKTQDQPCQPLPNQDLLGIAWIPHVANHVPVVLMNGDDPWDFFLSYRDRSQQLNDLQNLLQTKTLVSCPVPPLKGSTVVVFENGEYYRGITTGPVWNKTGRVSVLKVDYNVTSLVNVSELCSMPEDVAKFPCQVIRCCLNSNPQLKKAWGPEFKSYFSQLCQDFPIKIDVINEVMHCTQPKFLVKMWIFNEKLNEQVSIGWWLDEKLFPAMSDAISAGEDSDDLFMVLSDVLSPFSVPIDELYEDSQTLEGVTTEYGNEAECEAEPQESSNREQLQYRQFVGAGSADEEEYKIDEPLSEEIEMSIEKVNGWMVYKPKTIPKEVVVEPSFDRTRTKGTNSTQTSRRTCVSPDNDAPAASVVSPAHRVDHEGGKWWMGVDGISISNPTSRSQEEMSNRCGVAKTYENAPYLPLEGQIVKIIVHHVLTGTTFYASIDEFSIEVGAPGSTGNSMSALYEEINDVVSHPLLDSPPQVGDTVLAQGLQRYLNFLGKGKKWLRAVVKAVNGSSVEAFFVDFGNTDTIPVKDLRKLRPEFNSLPFQAILVKLAFLEPAKREAKLELTKLIKGKLLHADIVCRDVASTELEVLLFDGATSINNHLAVEELCTPV